ncbi:hypothetical protein SAMN02745216_03180 [Desulfatibacillum alkenivorans DSM 16219]|jgi:hypothetical protein|uniref:Alginate export n=1 Tax=Desulfatibacillum alkenivorans DSM 16219 TaxID=1121393 RepID=A0A1M6R3D0_9BACT|nr:hypothetical protein [Desulfatibacillum alkenivorans]SHK26942.1 hypothetical protein SAMN02745216_03180 [Desulfatibacillum alkenivorans DSM 16219]
MKKIFTIAMVIALVAAFTLPAMAETKFSFKGAYRVRGFMLSNPSLQADQAAVKATGTLGKETYTAPILATGEGPSQSWMDMRFRMESTFTVSDRLAVVTRFDALDNKRYGDPDTVGTSANIDWDRAYMVVKTDFGKFQAGRMAGGTYGNVFLDTETERDRVRFDTMLDKWVISLIYEKQVEIDGGTLWTDSDADVYYAAATYLSEDLRGGLLVGYGNVKAFSDLNGLQAYQYAVAPGVTLPLPYDSSLLLADPFVNANFGDFNVSAEAQIRWGKYAEFDRDVYQSGITMIDAWRKSAGLGPQGDIDYDAYAWNLEGSWASGPFGAEIGYAWVKGEDDPYDDKYESVGGLGDDWGKAFILTNTDSGFEATLGGHGGAAAAGATAGNLSSGSTAALNGCKMFYLGGSYSPMDNLTISALFANSKSESPGYVGYSTTLGATGNGGAPLPKDARNFASDHGSEYDLTINWDIYDNLNYTFIAAFLDVGDYWQFGNPYRELENTWCFWQQLQLSF